MIAILYELIDGTIGLMAALNGFVVPPFAINSQYMKYLDRLIIVALNAA
jgi:hypothetical protein